MKPCIYLFDSALCKQDVAKDKFDNATIIFFIVFFSSEDQAKLAARKYARIVQKLGFPVSYYSYFNADIIHNLRTKSKDMKLN